MGLKPQKRVLVIEDEPSWQRLIGDLLREVASTLDCEIEVVTAARFAEALNEIDTKSYDCITVDNKLLDGKRAKTLLDRIAGLDYRVPVIVISGAVDPGDVRDFFKDYQIEEFFWKDNFSSRQSEQTFVKLLASNGKNEGSRIEECVQQSDSYSSYETGLRQLLNQLGQDHPHYRETLVYQQRLVENISWSRLYGNLDTREAKRSEIIDRLNEVALAALGMPFNELCNPTSVEVNKENRQSPQHTKIGDKHMDWNTIVSLAVSTVATSAATAAGKELVGAASENIKGLWKWIRETVSESNNEPAKQALERFEKAPESNKAVLVDVIKQLSPDDDTILRGYVKGLIQEVQLRKGANLFSLLDNRTYYTFNDLKRICSRVSPRWEDETGSNPKREALARWAVNHAPTRNKQQDLIAAMLEVNPTVMLQ